jgi:hypothetical protein
MPAIPQSPAQPSSPAAPGAPPNPSAQGPFGEPAGETLYSNSPSYERPVPPDTARSRTVSYLLLAGVVIVVLVVATLVATGTWR